MAAAVQVPWIPALQKDTRIRNAHSSTAIEGNPLTLEQVRAIEEGREIPATAQRARREVANYFAGLRFVEKNAQRAVITHAEVLKLHRIMAGKVMDQGTAGEYRAIRVRVGDYVAPRAGAGAADDVRPAGVVEQRCGKNFSDSQFGRRASPV